MKEYKYKEVKDQVRMQIIGLAEGIQLRAVAAGAGWTWWLTHVTARGETKSWPLPDLGAPGQVEAGIPPAARNSPALRSALLALPSLANRPSDYGVTREDLEGWRQHGTVDSIIYNLPIGKKIGRVKVQLRTLEEKLDALNALRGWEVGARIVVALTAAPEDTKVVAARIPADVHHRLTSEAAATLMSPGQFVAHLLRERYKEDRI